MSQKDHLFQTKILNSIWMSIQYSYEIDDNEKRLKIMYLDF